MSHSVSVVIPTYNGSTFLPTTLASVYAQTVAPSEVVIVDDCSTDDTVAIASEFASTAPMPVRLIRLRQNSGGPAEPVNVGIDAARHPFIATLDHDDRMTPNRLHDQVGAALACPDAGIILGRVFGDDPSGTRGTVAERGWDVLRLLPSVEVTSGVFRVAAADAYRALLAEGCYGMTCSAFLFPKSVWKRAGGFDRKVRTACDYSFLRAVTRNYDLAFVNSAVARWSCQDATLFNTAGSATRLEETWSILKDFRSDDLPTELKGPWIAAARRLLADGGYQLREAGKYGRALRFHLRSALWCGLDRSDLTASVKVLAAALTSRTRH
jgi:glycosyltransferase involved in cell wall biosynthesis